MAHPKSGQFKTGQDLPDVAKKWTKALSLRTAGATYQQIARQVGYADEGAAYKAVQSALKASLREPAEETRSLELKRLDRLTLAVWQRATQGDAEAIDRVLKISDRRAKLLGLDSPTKVAPTNPDGTAEYSGPLTEAERATRAAQLFAEVAGRAALPKPG